MSRLTESERLNVLWTFKTLATGGAAQMQDSTAHAIAEKFRELWGLPDYTTDELLAKIRELEALP